MTAPALAQLPVVEFLDRLASSAPTPGGGSAAALGGAVAAALGRMVCALTLGKAKFAAVEEQVRDLAARLEKALAMFQRLMDEDAAAYGELSAAFKLPKDDPSRAPRVAQAAAVAAAVPLQIAALARKTYADLKQLETLGNPNLHSDVVAGLHFAEASLRAAAANVRVNLPFLPPPEAQRMEKELNWLVGG